MHGFRTGSSAAASWSSRTSGSRRRRARRWTPWSSATAGIGDVVENAFLITTVEWREVHWRMLARMTVRFGAEGAPTAVTELVTVQQVGFSGSRCQS